MYLHELSDPTKSIIILLMAALAALATWYVKKHSILDELELLSGELDKLKQTLIKQNNRIEELEKKCKTTKKR